MKKDKVTIPIVTGDKDTDALLHDEQVNQRGAIMSKDKKLKVVNLDCCLCGNEIDTQVIKSEPDKVIWTEGHNAEPLKEGKCCTKCNMDKVVPFRILCTIDDKLEKVNQLLLKVNHSIKVDGVKNIYALKYQQRLIEEVVLETQSMNRIAEEWEKYDGK